MTDQFVVETVSPPQGLSDDAYEACAQAILHEVQAGVADPLLGLSDETEQDLLTLAYTDTIRLDKLERRIKEAIRTRDNEEAGAKAFNLGTYRRGAKQLQQQIAASNARRAALRARGLGVVEGGKGDPQLAAIPRDASASEQADLYSNSPHLQALAWLRANKKGRVWFDTFYQDFFTNWSGDLEDDAVIEGRRVEDGFMRRVHTTLHRVDVRLAKTSDANTTRALYTMAEEDLRNEPQDWLRGLEWDGTERLATWLHHVYGVPQDQYHSDVGRCWLVSMAARVMRPGCKVDTMPVLFGPQGTGKSQSLAALGGKWYATINTSAEKNDFVLALAGLVVGEIAELDAISGRRVENSRVKSLITTSEDLVRPPYGRTHRTYKRTVVMVGTTNDPGWHRDETGGRRFWPIECVGEIDVAWLEANRDQLFAEAKARLDRGEKWWDVDRAEQERRMAEHYSDDPWEQRIEGWLEAGIREQRLWSGVPGEGATQARAGDEDAPDESGHWGTLVTTSRILTQCMQVPVERQSRNASLQVARVMKKAGWVQKAVRGSGETWGKTTRAWVRNATAGGGRGGEGPELPGMSRG